MDVNVLVYAHREDVREHLAYLGWLEEVINSGVAYGYSELVLSGFVRVVTHPRVFEQPSSLACALEFAEQVRGAEHAIRLSPGSAHWVLFRKCMEDIDAQGNDIPDAYHAALALEWDCEWVTTDKGFRRFKGLRVRHPLR